MAEKHPECPLYNPVNCREYYNPKVCAVVRKDKACLKKRKSAGAGRADADAAEHPGAMMLALSRETS